MKKIILIFLAIIFYLDVSFAQDQEGHLQVKAKVLSQYASLPGTTVRVFTNNQLILDTITGKEGKLSYQLKYDYDFVFEFSKEGYITKSIEINTHVPEKEKSEIGFFEFKVTLFTVKDSLQSNSKKQPAAKISFDSKGKLFNYRDHVKPVIDTLLFQYKKAKFNEGFEGFQKYMNENVKYDFNTYDPKMVAAKISFILTGQGTIDSLKIDSASVSKNTEEDILAAIKASDGKWTPAELAGEKINSLISVSAVLSAFNLYDYKSFPAINVGTFFYNLGVKNAQEENYSKAIDCFSAVLKLNPNDIDALYNRGIMYHKNKRNYASCRDWQKAKDLGDTESEKLFLKYCNEYSSDTINGIYTLVDTMPTFPGGGEAAMLKFLGQNIKYPPLARENGIDGNVYVTFIIDKDGYVEDAQVLRGIGGGCDEEALRVVNLMPPWIPGKKDGKRVNVQYNLPIKFTLR